MEIKDDYLVYVFVFIGWKDGLVVEFYVERRNYGLSGYCKYRIKRHEIQDIIFSWPLYHDLSLDCLVSFANAVFIVIVKMIVLFVFVVFVFVIVVIVLIWLQ